MEAPHPGEVLLYCKSIFNFGFEDIVMDEYNTTEFE